LLAEQSEEVRQRLLAGAEGEDEVNLTAAGSKTTVSTSAAGHDYGGHVPHFPSVARPADASEGMLTDLPAVARILHSPDSEAWRLLRELRAQAWHAPANALASLFGGGFASVAIDRLNECALEGLGDSLLFEEGNEWVVADDFRDEVAYLLDHPQLLAGPEMAVPPTNTEEAPPAVDVAWQTFAAQLKPWHWQALAVLALDGANGSGPIKLDAIARAQLSTANQLIDEVNTIALDTIGDNVVDASGGAPAIFDEYTQPMRQLAQWAIECEKTEVIA
jgi:hypothetical protein